MGYVFRDIVELENAMEGVRTGEEIVIAPDTNFLMRTSKGFWMSAAEKYALRVVPGVARELQGKLIERGFGSCPVYRGKLTCPFRILNEGEVVSDWRDSFFISEASKIAKGRNCGLGKVDEQQIGYAVKRAREGASTVILSNDGGMKTALSLLKEEPALFGFLKERVEILSNSVRCGEGRS